MDDLLTITVDCARDPDGSRLQALLDAQSAYEHACAVRDRWLVTLGLFCVGVWIVAMPDYSDSPWALPLAAAFLFVGARALMAGVIEHRAYRRWSEVLDSHPGAVVH